MKKFSYGSQKAKEHLLQSLNPNSLEQSTSFKITMAIIILLCATMVYAAPKPCGMRKPQTIKEMQIRLIPIKQYKQVKLKTGRLG